MPPRNAADPPPDLDEVLALMANNSALLTAAVASLATSQASFMRSAADADANIGLSKSHSLLLLLRNLLPARSTIQWMMHTEMASQLLTGTTGLPCLVTMLTTLLTMTTTVSTLVTVLPGVSVTTTPPLIVPIDSPHGTELEAATSELSRNSCLRTAI